MEGGCAAPNNCIPTELTVDCTSKLGMRHANSEPATDGGASASEAPSPLADDESHEIMEDAMEGARGACAIKGALLRKAEAGAAAANRVGTAEGRVLERKTKRKQQKCNNKKTWRGPGRWRRIDQYKRVVHNRKLYL
jgi:hypothetical protein